MRSVIQRLRPRSSLQMAAAVVGMGVSSAVTVGAILYHTHLSHIRRIPNDEQSLIMTHPKPNKIGVAAVPYADTFEVIVRVPYQTPLGINGADVTRDKIFTSSEAATTAFSRAFFTSLNFQLERLIIRYGSGGAPVRDAMLLSHPFDPTASPDRIPADAPSNGIIIPNGFQMVRRKRSQLLLQWPPQSPAIDANPKLIFSGLSWLSAQVLVTPKPPAPPASTAAAITSSETIPTAISSTSSSTAAPVPISSSLSSNDEYATIRFRFGSRVWPSLGGGNNDNENAIAAKCHRFYARVCLYLAVKRLFPDFSPNHVYVSKWV